MRVNQRCSTQRHLKREPLVQILSGLCQSKLHMPHELTLQRKDVCLQGQKNISTMALLTCLKRSCQICPVLGYVPFLQRVRVQEIGRKKEYLLCQALSRCVRGRPGTTQISTQVVTCTFAETDAHLWRSRSCLSHPRQDRLLLTQGSYWCLRGGGSFDARGRCDRSRDSPSSAKGKPSDTRKLKRRVLKRAAAR
jgi:hypothetical protein